MPRVSRAVGDPREWGMVGAERLKVLFQERS